MNYYYTINKTFGVVLFVFVIGVLLSCERSGISSVESGRNGLSSGYTLDSYQRMIDGIEGSSDDEREARIEYYYGACEYTNRFVEGGKIPSIYRLCQQAVKRGKYKTVRAMVSQAFGDERREDVALNCLSSEKNSEIVDIGREWAERIEYEENQHLVPMISFLKNSKEVAKEIINSNKFRYMAKCRAAIALADVGDESDVVFLKQKFEERVERKRLIRDNPWTSDFDCGKFAIDKLNKRLLELRK